MNIFANPNFNFMNKRIPIYFISGLFILIGLVVIIINGGLKYNIDFSGGLALEIAPIEVAVDETESSYLTVTQIRETLNRGGIGDFEIQELPNTRSFLIKAKSEGGIGDQIVEVLKAEFPEHTAEADFIRAQDEVGPRAGADLRAKAVNSVLISLFFILLYIWIRFRFTWGFIAALGLFHDVMITLIILSFMGMEIGMTILAAMLTVVGYSINNTIVIFDRIRENLKLYRKEDDFQIVNRSINETLNRTIVMAFTTLLVNISLMTFGGPVIFDFAFTFMVGVLAGTYSSMLLVTGVVLDTVLALKKRKAVAIKGKR